MASYEARWCCKEFGVTNTSRGPRVYLQRNRRQRVAPVSLAGKLRQTQAN